MQEKIAELVRDKRIEGISDIRDESDRDGIRVVIELKRDAVADVVLNQLYRFTPLQTSFGANMVALNGGRPELLGIKDILAAFIAFREEVVSRRTKFLLGKARDRAHVLVGLAMAVANIDEVIALIRAAPDPQTAREQLMARHWPAHDIEPLIAADRRPAASDRRATAPTGCRRSRRAPSSNCAWQRLTALGRDEIAEELEKLAAEIRDYLEILASRARIQAIVNDELTAIRDEFATPRRTEIVEGGADLEDEDLIQREDMVVTVSHAGYIKRVALSEYRAQRRGGKGRSGMATREEDFVTKLFVANTHTPVLFFSSRGMVYKMKVWRLPLAAPQARGKALVNLLPLQQGERITSILPLPEDEASWEGFDVDLRHDPRHGPPQQALRLHAGEPQRQDRHEARGRERRHRRRARSATERDDVLLTTARGQCIRFPVGRSARLQGARTSMGVRGISLRKGDDGHLARRSCTISMRRRPSAQLYLKQAAAIRRAVTRRGAKPRAEDADIGADEGDEAETARRSDAFAGALRGDERGGAVRADRRRELGYGKRSSSYDFRVSGRGGKGIKATDTTKLGEIGQLVAAFPVEPATRSCWSPTAAR